MQSCNFCDIIVTKCNAAIKKSGKKISRQLGGGKPDFGVDYSKPQSRTSSVTWKPQPAQRPVNAPPPPQQEVRSLDARVVSMHEIADALPSENLIKLGWFFLLTDLKRVKLLIKLIASQVQWWMNQSDSSCLFCHTHSRMIEFGYCKKLALQDLLIRKYTN